jgi:hypothetical protein
MSYLLNATHHRFRRLLGGLLTVLILTVAVGNKAWYAHIQETTKASLHQQAASKAASDPANDSPVQTVVSELSAIVTPATSFAFQHTGYLLPTPTWSLLLAVSVVVIQPFHEPFFFLSYFRKVFGHYIAINAP